MLGLKCLRWSGTGISNGRQRLTAQMQTSRSLSSTSKPSFNLPNRIRNTQSPLHRSKWTSRSSQHQTASFSSTARFQSTVAPPPPIAGPASSPPPAPSPVPSTLDQLSSEYETSIRDIPEHIGYLKELGLDYGWGPTSLMEFLLEHIHIWGGIPWWASIAVLAVGIRIAMFRLVVAATDQQARMQRMQPLTKPIQARMVAAMKAKNEVAALSAKKELRALNKQAGIQIWKSFGPMMLLIPAGFGQFRLGRGMADLPVPALENESLLWLPDMTMGDPYFILPLATGFVVYRTMKKGGEMGGSNAQIAEPMRIFMTYALPAISTTFMLVWPATLQIYFFIAAATGFVQSSALRNPTIRAFFGITPMPVHPKTPDYTSAAGSGISTIETAAQAAARKAEENQSFIDKGLGRVSKGYGKLKKTGEEMMMSSGYQPPKIGEAGKKKGSGKRSSQEVRTAEAYEKRRREEMEMKRVAREEMMRKGGGGKDRV